MAGAGGNVAATALRAVKTKNAKGVAVAGEPERLVEIRGWLDYQSGQSSHLAYQAKIRDATHLFISDYNAAFAALAEAGLSLAIDGKQYEVLLIDDPLGLHEHLETYLRYVGAG